MRLLFTILLLACYTSANAQIPDEERQCIKQQNLAQKDMYNDEMKYYSFGITSGYDKNNRARALVLKEYYNIEIRHEGCVMQAGYNCYNNMVEQIAKRKYGKDFWQQVDRKTDSLLAIGATQPR